VRQRILSAVVDVLKESERWRHRRRRALQRRPAAEAAGGKGV